jgi:O-antigen/teichoic acid export membrane protein
MNQKKGGTILSFAAIFIKILVTFTYIPFVLDKIGKDNYGLFSIIGAIIAYIAILDFGINDSTLRFFVRYRKEVSEEQKKQILGSVSAIYLILTGLVLLVSSIVYFCLPFLFSNTFSVQEMLVFKQMYLISIVSVAFTIFFNPTGAIINAYEKFIILKLADILVFVATTITIVIFLNFNYNVVMMVFVASFFNILNVLFKFFYVRAKINISYPTYQPSKKLVKKIALYAGPIFIVIVVEQIYWKLDNIIIGAMLGTTMVTYYAMGIVFQKYILSFSTAISRIMTPDLIKKIDANYSLVKLTNNYIKTSRIQLIVVMAIVMNLIFWGKSFLKIWLGEEYVVSYYVLILVMIPFSIEIIGNLRNTFLQVYGYYWHRAIVILVVSVLNIGLTVLLIDKYGIIGAAGSTCISLFLGYGATNFILWKKIGIDVSSFFREVWLKVIPVMAILGILFLFLNNTYQITNWLKLIIHVTITSFVYILAIWYFYLTKEEKLFFIKKK